MSTDYCALCAELADALDSSNGFLNSDGEWVVPEPIGTIVDRARAALAQPEPVGPTDEELDRLEHPHWEETGVEEWGRREAIFNHRSYARAVLARWGHHPAHSQAPLDGKDLQRIQRICAIVLGHEFGNSELDSLALELGHHPSILNALPLPDGPAVPEGREPASVACEPSDGDLLQLMPEQFRADLGTVSRMAAHGAGPDIKPGLFRVSLNTGALEYARAVLARWGQPTTPETTDEQP